MSDDYLPPVTTAQAWGRVFLIFGIAVMLVAAGIFLAGG